MTDAEEIVREGVIAVIERGGLFLSIIRSATVIAPGKLCFPGGGVEPGETEKEALVRECFEELGGRIIPGEKIDVSVTPWKVRLHWYTATLPNDVELRPNPKEIAEIRWMTIREMREHPDLLESNIWFLEKLLQKELLSD